jgi:putative ABC transport system permease protein
MGDGLKRSSARSRAAVEPRGDALVTDSSWRHGTNPLWGKAPLVLLRYPGALVALLVGALLLALTITAYPLFVSASASRLVEDQVTAPLMTRYGAGITYLARDVPLSGGTPAPLYRRRDELFGRLASESPSLGTPVATVLGPNVSVAPAEDPGRARAAQVFAGTGATDHVGVVSRMPGAEGAWLPDSLVRGLGVEPGDRVSIRTGEGSSVEMDVTGVYRALYGEPRRGYWLPWDREIYGSQECATCPGPPPFVLVPPDRVEDVLGSLEVRAATYGWQAPVARGRHLSLEEAQDLEAFVARFRARISDDSTEAGRVFDCCHGGVTFGMGQDTEFFSRMRLVVSQVEERLGAIEGPGRLLQWAGIAVALAVLAGAGVFGLAARATETRLLVARGTGPAVAGVKAGLEAVLPTLVGAVVGLGLSLLLVGAVGPEGPLSSAARPGAIWGAVAAFGLGVAAVGVTAGISAAGHHSRGHVHRSILSRVPWEIGLLAVAVLAYRGLQTGGAVIGEGTAGRPGFWLLLFPVALIGGLAVAGGRLFRMAFRRLRRRSESFRPPSYLAVQRVAGAPGLAVLLFGAAGLCLGVFVQARTMVGSLERTVDAKARVFTGSDVRAWIGPDTTAPDDFSFPATKVTRLARAGVMGSSGGSFDLLAVDPETLASAAYWNESFSEVPFTEIADRLDASGRSPLPIALAGPGPEGTGTLEINQRIVPVEVVARTGSFPGMYPHRPLVVVDSSAVCEPFRDTLCPISDADARHELWVKGDTERAVAALAAIPEGTFSIITAEEVKDIPYIAAVIDTFVVLNALGLGTAVLVVAAMLLYLQARERSQLVAYGLSLRMGMTHRAHRRSLFLEVGATLAAAFVLGVAVAMLSVFLMIRFLDPLATIPPAPFLIAPGVLIGLSFLALVAVSWLGAWLADRRARTRHLGEVMRVAE